jgi:hypothetical protein
MRISYYAVSMFLILATSAFATVSVSSPATGSPVGSPVHYAATATTTCSKGVASMGIYVNNQLVYVENGASLNTNWPFNPGNYNTVVEEWDYCGGATYTPVAITVTNQTGVWVTSPANQSKVSSPANYVATANTGTCSKGVASMGVYVDNQLVYVKMGASLNTALSLNAGTYNTVVEEWDYCGGASYTPVTITVVGGGKVLSGIQSSKGWTSYGEFAPNYEICSWPCPGVTGAMTQGIQSPSLSGHSTEFSIGGTTPYSDVLWTNPLIGQNSSQGLPDSSHTLLPTLHNFTYDAYFYPTNLGVTQVLEFDISMYFNGLGLIWGHQCRIAGGNEWDIWDNVNARWVATGVACNPVNNSWNHVTIQAEREPDNSLLFQSITLNGATSYINQTYAPGSAPNGWWGITVNYQEDGNYKQSSYTTFLDNFNFTYE